MPAAVTSPKFELAQIQCPEPLRHLPAWLVWRFEQDEGEPKPRKVPHYVAGGRRHGAHGRDEDRQRLTTFDAARAWAARRGFDGVGFAPLPEFGIVALDFDNCVDADGLLPEVENLVAGTYAEWSPSGRGVRAFLQGSLGNHKSASEPFGFETFSTKGFVTFTGNRLESVELLGTAQTVAPVPAALRAYCETRFGRRDADPFDDDPLMADGPIGLTESQILEALDVLDPDLPHAQWLGVGMALHHETDGDGFELWQEWSEQGDKYPGEDALRRRWESFGAAGGRKITARSLVKLANENGARVGLGESSVASAEDFDAAAQSPAPEPKAKPQRFAVQAAHEFADGPPPRWLVKGLVPEAELVIVFGPPGSGKSFLVFDIAACIARGLLWRGLKVRQGRVVWIAAEGAGGFRNRLQAYARHNELALEDLGIGVIPAAPNFLLKDDALDVAKAVLAFGGADLVVVDTTAQVTPGANENSSEDMGKCLAHCKGIHRATGATVLLVHHSGKDADRGARGWSGLKGAADAELEVIRAPAGRALHNSKQKDGEDGQVWGFDLEVVPVGVDEDGDVVDSCVVVEAAAPAQGTKPAGKRRGVWEQRVLDVLAERALGQTAGIEIEPLLDDVVALAEKPEGRDTRRQHAKRALNKVLDEPDGEYMREDDGTVSVL